MIGAQRGVTLVVGLILLAVVSLLALAAASAAQIERRLAQNQRFRENASSAASAGIELAITHLVNSSDPAAADSSFTATMPRSSERIAVSIRFAGYERALPQAPGAGLVAAHFEVVSTGFSARRAVDRQRALILRVVESAEAEPLPCAPITATPCRRAGDLIRAAWQRLPAR